MMTRSRKGSVHLEQKYIYINWGTILIVNKPKPGGLFHWFIFFPWIPPACFAQESLEEKCWTAVHLKVSVKPRLQFRAELYSTMAFLPLIEDFLNKCPIFASEPKLEFSLTRVWRMCMYIVNLHIILKDHQRDKKKKRLVSVFTGFRHRAYQSTRSYSECFQLNKSVEGVQYFA